LAATRTSRPEVRRTPDRPFAIHLYCGKGGVGKTTLSVAAARREAARGRRVLVVSTDPAHSLHDALGRKPPRRIEAVELEAARALERWLGPRRAAFERLLLRGTLLDREDVARLLQLALPGVDELVALVEIERLAAARHPDLVIVDTAPTGHTWRLLASPETIRAVAGVLDAMLARDRDVAAAVGGRAPRDAADALVEALAQDAARLAARLRDPRLTRIVWITLAEPVAVAEALDGVAWLRARGLPLTEIVVNRAAGAARSCPMCRARAAVGQASIAPLRRAARGVRFTFVRDRPVQSRPIRDPGDAAIRRQKRPALVPEGLKVVIVAGKGGVGKTTVACGLAIEAARTHRGRRALLLSSDPAHSLGDVLRTRLGDSVRRVPGVPGLEAREIDARAALARERDEIRRGVEEAFDARPGGGVHVDLAHDRDVALRLIDLSPPGVDEILALVSVLDAVDRYDLVVVDTAPTGHALKFLAMPEVAAGWLSELMRILLKYRDVARMGPLGEQVVRLSRGVRRLQVLFRDPAQTRAVVVTRAAELPRLETIRLLDALDRLGIRTSGVVVNAATPTRTNCPRCRAARRMEAAEIAALASARRTRRAEGCDIIVAPLALPPPRGVARVTRWMRQWAGDIN
jgi:arsenite/tail-anchored protein-transporting ATPase